MSALVKGRLVALRSHDPEMRRRVLLGFIASGRVFTCDQLRRLVGVSERTIYRDIAALRAEGVDIRGQAGFGHVLRAAPPFDGLGLA